jgi:protein gp37
MGDTPIQWTDKTWNPIRGCSLVSEGCRNCYAMGVAARFSGPGLAYEGLARRRSNGEPQWTGEVRVIESHMLDPLSWRKPVRVFVNSMSDLFHDSVTDETIERVFAVMALAPRHTFQILTKRPDRMLAWSLKNSTGGRIFHVAQQIDPKGVGASSGVWPLPNVWLGVSTENQEAADERIPLLLQTPAAVRFLSCEPLLGPIELKNCGTTPYFSDRGCLPDGRGTSVDWVIVGGESGRHARPCDVEWITDIVAQCDFAGVPVFVKQMGRWIAADAFGEFKRPAERWLFADGRVWVPGTIGVHNYKRPKDAVAFSLGSHGDEMDAWPEELRIRQFPNTKADVEDLPHTAAGVAAEGE